MCLNAGSIAVAVKDVYKLSNGNVTEQMMTATKKKTNIEEKSLLSLLCTSWSNTTSNTRLPLSFQIQETQTQRSSQGYMLTIICQLFATISRSSIVTYMYNLHFHGWQMNTDVSQGDLFVHNLMLLRTSFGTIYAKETNAERLLYKIRITTIWFDCIG